MPEMRIMSARQCLSILSEDLQENLREMGVKPETGDTKIIWNPEDSNEVESARRTWNELVRDKRFLGFRVTSKGEKGERISAFDPDAAKLIITPPMGGGR